MRLPSFLLAATLALSACADAAPTGHVTPDRARVFALPDGQFEVAPPQGAVRSAFWCGAADYARRALGAGWGQGIYVARGLGEGVAVNRKSTVHFTLTPVASERGDSWLKRTNAYRVGDRLSVQQADHQCTTAFTRF
ncbi:hypothetical protein BWR17_16300 [Phaeobacter inhibens]|uniref:hypothetical protein n=1 Tax=Phaeobacter inhibens TaxID=221822 RepID=UPI000971A143|nr:hypothetical protein [Phaeobacter inhibens]APX17240.1 hypothetical protein BWR17_16300 [Phaeobacter inhibens]